MEYTEGLTIPYAERNLSPEIIQHELGLFAESLVELYDNPPGGSPVVRAFCEVALVDLYDNDNFPEFQESITNFIQDRHDPYVFPHIKAQLLWRSYNYIFLKRAEAYDPSNYVDRTKWHNEFSDILTGKTPDNTRECWLLEELLATKNIQTNVPLRYAAAKLAIEAFRDILPTQPTFVDAGCSAQYGQIQLEENIPFEGIELLTRDQQLRRQIRASLSARRLYNNTVGFDQVAGIDKDWVRANNYPEEHAPTHKNYGREKLRRALTEHYDRNVYKRVHGDLTLGDAGIADVLVKNGGRKFDVAMALTTLYEVPLPSRLVALRTLESLATALSVVVDFVEEIDPGDPTNLIFSQTSVNSAKYNYKLYARPLIDSDADAPYEHLATFDSGRCNKMIPEPALVTRFAALQG